MTENADSDEPERAAPDDDGYYHPTLTQRQVDRLWAVLRSQRTSS